MPQDLARIEAIFNEALGKASATLRAAYLAEVCGDDTGLRQHVERLLAARVTAGAFSAPSDSNRPSYAPLQEHPGSKIGRYKLLQQIGEGGFGVVFMAEQEEPVRRLVALKIIKLGMDTRQVVARFEAERQALAMMDHPGVAKVLDGGATETGRPYFVMDLVKGTPITEYCDKNKLNIPQRLELFAQACQAVQHAHQKGLIHRDIKPSNVLVSTQDDKPVAKVIDFGIAKAMQARLTERTLFTEFCQLMGTPEYTSPEQAEGGLDMDTRSDIYSLGVLLYELLAGSPPFDAKELRSKAYAEMQRIIREVEPPAPSTRLNTIKETLPAVAAHRSIEPRQLQTMVRGELDCIVMRCLEKDRNRRYQTASAVTEDIQRYRVNEPVHAQPATRRYRIKKFIHRNKVGVLTGAAIVGALLVGLTLASIGFVQARRQAVRADREASAARTQAARSDEVAGFLQKMLRSVSPRVAMGRDTTLLRKLLDSAAERVGRDLHDQPEVEAALRYTIGQAYNAIGRDAEAEAMHRRALALYKQIYGEEHRYVAYTLDSLAYDCSLTKPAEAEALHREVLTLWKRLGLAESPETAGSLEHLTLDLLRKDERRSVENSPDRLAEAEAVQRQALAMFKKTLGDDHSAVASALDMLALVLRSRGDLAGAEAAERQSLEMRRRLEGEVSPNLAQSLGVLAGIMASQGKLPEAEALGRQGLAMRRKILGVNDHPDIAYALWGLADVLQREGKLTEAESANREALATWRKFLGNEHPYVAGILIGLGNTLRGEGKLSEAEDAFREAFTIRKNVYGNSHFQTVQAKVELIDVLLHEDKIAEADKLRREGTDSPIPLSPATRP